jgi:hypothetical protein
MFLGAQWMTLEEGTMALSQMKKEVPRRSCQDDSSQCTEGTIPSYHFLSQCKLVDSSQHRSYYLVFPPLPPQHPYLTDADCYDWGHDPIKMASS